jgi:hypothetical protein
MPNHAKLSPQIALNSIFHRAVRFIQRLTAHFDLCARTPGKEKCTREYGNEEGSHSRWLHDGYVWPNQPEEKD